MSTVVLGGGWTQREEKPRQGSLLGNQHGLLVCTNGHPRFTFTRAVREPYASYRSIHPLHPPFIVIKIRLTVSL